MKQQQTSGSYLQECLLTHSAWTMQYSDVVKLLNFWPRGHPYRVYLLVLSCSGMRTSECDKLTHDDFKNGGVIYRLGKNQHGRRSVLFPVPIWGEIQEYLKNNPASENHIWPSEEQYGIKTKFGYGRCVNRGIHKVRHKLGGNFLAKVPGAGAVGDRYILALKCFRANHQCIQWWKYYSQEGPLGGSGELAAAFVSKEMHHSGNSFGLTAKHYISGIEYIKEDLSKLKAFVVDGKVGVLGQVKLDYFANPFLMRTRA